MHRRPPTIHRLKALAASIPPEVREAIVELHYHDSAPKGHITGPDDVIPWVRGLRRATREHFIVLLLNSRHEAIHKETVSIGSLNASIVHPREVFRPAITHSAAAIVLIHNHPSGDPEPSAEDLSITKRLSEAGELLGIPVLDHVIVAGRSHTSFRSRNLLC